MVKKWLKFEELPIEVKKKTKIINVLSKKDGWVLGCIEWNTRWHQYVFEPNPEIDSIWSWDCLLELSNFIKSLMNER